MTDFLPLLHLPNFLSFLIIRCLCGDSLEVGRMRWRLVGIVHSWLYYSLRSGCCKIIWFIYFACRHMRLIFHRFSFLCFFYNFLIRVGLHASYIHVIGQWLSNGGSQKHFDIRWVTYLFYIRKLVKRLFLFVFLFPANMYWDCWIYSTLPFHIDWLIISELQMRGGEFEILPEFRHSDAVVTIEWTGLWLPY